MPDEFDTVHLDHDDSQSIIDWAVSAAAVVMLMSEHPPGENDEEELDRLRQYQDAITMMVDEMPEVLISPAALVAEESLQEAFEEESAVEQFREQMKDI